MKHVIFMVINMNVGGTEKALLNRIEKMPKEKYNITILMLEEYGEFLKEVPAYVNIIFLEQYHALQHLINDPPRNVIVNHLKKGKLLSVFVLIYVYSLSKLTGNPTILFNYVLRNVPPLKENFDVAVAYAGPMDFISYFVMYHIHAKKKLQWIHFDVTKIGFNRAFASRIYNKFDEVLVVSHEGKAKLMAMLPALKTKVKICTNRLDIEQIRRKAANGIGFEDQFNGIRILTVGRLSKEKGQDLVIPVLAKLKANGYHVKWYCVGEGNARSEYESLIKSFHLENDFILLGEKTNPYPYMKACDLYVQPSRHEGYCITLSEVKCFHKMIISTDFTGANEQITGAETGIIVPCHQQEIYDAITHWMAYKKRRERGSSIK